ncbi:hypothetical protein J2X66_000268 [Pseudomonas sp. 3296]|uniref:integrase n=1 Tax=Pseudomonas sp. 3296 TaxID=2817753 RepID=UPI002856074D|nr:integrase [Pseudomonas sp. 3296]MDR6913421.1 hypothetical protein [Pseudomonas sp. 3296]
MNIQSAPFLIAYKKGSVAPDTAGATRPSANFVLCRDKYGTPTAVYGADAWDFNPYRLSAHPVQIFRFNKIFKENKSEQKNLTEQVKYLMFCYIYHAAGHGRLGKLSVSTIKLYYHILADMARFCHSQKLNSLVGTLSFEQLLTTPSYLAAFVRHQGNRNNFKSLFPAMMSNLAFAGEKCLGYNVLNVSDISFTHIKNNKQHPVIPLRIYIEIINRSADILDVLHNNVQRIESFILAFKDTTYGYPKVTQQRLKIPKTQYRPNFQQALIDHGMNSVFHGDFVCHNRKSLSMALLSMQYVLKIIIHLYTGMRDQEVMRLKHDCTIQVVTEPETRDDDGVLRDPEKMISILSTTTKFEGYKKEESWLATSEVLRAIEVAQALCRSLAQLYGIKNLDDCPLFLNPAAIFIHPGGATNINQVKTLSKYSVNSQWLDSLTIQPSDLIELGQTDPARNFYEENKFCAGSPWPLTSHQFRRSLAFYATSSGFVSLPSLKSQFKHLTLEMARYYANNFDKLKTIFGYFDTEKKDFVLPSTHIALEFQMGIPIGVANQLISDLLLQDKPLFGGTGSYIEKQKAQLDNDEILIEDVRRDTLRRVNNGEISYRPTTLGGCTKVGRCDSFMMGDFTECLSCEGAIIQFEKVEEAISDTSKEIVNYEVNSGEYQITKTELDRLKKFKARIIGATEI